jgi:hypothetical protein
LGCENAVSITSDTAVIWNLQCDIFEPFNEKRFMVAEYKEACTLNEKTMAELNIVKYRGYGAYISQISFQQTIHIS